MGRYTNPRIRVYNDALTLQGTITTVLYAEFECMLDEIGEGYFVIPLVDTPGRQYCVENNVAVFTVEIDTVETPFGCIVITDVDDKTAAAAGQLIVHGFGHLHKLTYDRMNYTVISDGSGGKSVTARQDVLDLSQYTWTISQSQYDATPRQSGANLVAANETLFEALLQAIAQDQYHVVDRPLLPPTHTVYMAKDMDQLSSTPGGAEDVHFRPDADDTDTSEIPIPDGGIRVRVERAQVPTRAYIYGGGGGQDRFTNAEADGLVSPHSGFSFDFATSEVINDTLEAVSNQPTISDNKNFPNIKPEDIDDATSVQTAAIALCEAGLSYLIERQQANQTFYEIDPTFVGKVVWPGANYCRLTFSYESPYNAAGSEVTTTIINVDIQTHILGVRYVFGGDNVLMGEFLLGPAARILPTGDREVAGRVQNLEQRLDHLTAAPSTGAPSDQYSYANSDGTYLVLSTNTILTNERQFVPGAGLAGVDAGANSTYTVNVAAADTSMTINADSIQVRLAATSGLQVSTGLMIADTVAGAGLTIASKVLAVGAGDGIDVAADSIAVDVTDLIGTGLVEEATNNIAVDFTVVAAQTDLHAAVTLAADADTILGLSGQQLTLDTQLANMVFAGPVSGGAADPTMRALVAADLPTGQSISVSSANGGDSHAIDATIAASMLFSLLKWLPDIVAVYPMSHTPSNQLTDVIGGFHLTNNNTAVFDADTSYRNYVTLNGTNQYFSIADGSFTEISGTETYIASARRGLTIIAAVRFDSAATPATPEFICAKRGGLTSERGFGLQRNGDGTLGGTVHNGTTENAVNTSQTLGGSTWGIISFRYDPSSFVKIRLDDNADASNTTSIISSIQNNSEPFTVGARSDGAGGGTFFAGADIGFLVVCRGVLQDEWIDLVHALAAKVY